MGVVVSVGVASTVAAVVGVGETSEVVAVAVGAGADVSAARGVGVGEPALQAATVSAAMSRIAMIGALDEFKREPFVATSSALSQRFAHKLWGIGKEDRPPHPGSARAGPEER